MDSAISQVKTAPQICFSKSKLGFSSSPVVVLPVPVAMKKRRWRMECAKECAGWEEKELKKRSEKCAERGGGIVEMMECLEREAIMGEDEGREAIDYNRRALIFEKSATVFHALKQQTTTSTSTSTSTSSAL